MKIKAINGCARCGGNHKNVKFKRFKVPFKKFTHWARCPVSKDPILMYVAE